MSSYFSLASLLISLAGFEPIEQSQNISIYETTTKAGYFDAVAISSKYHRIKQFKLPYRHEIWQSDTGGRFEIERNGNVLFDRFTGFSVPIGLEKVETWTANETNCYANKFSKDKWVISCSGRAPGYFLYEKGLGITAFDYTCANKTPCWFELKSEVGVFANVDR